MDETLKREWRVAAQLLAELAHEIQVWRDGGQPSPVRAPAALALPLSMRGHSRPAGERGAIRPRRGTEPLLDCPGQPQDSPA